MADSIEYEIIENLKPRPLFSDVVRTGTNETNVKYFKGSEWLKSASSLIFNPGYQALLDKMEGHMDDHNNYVIASPYTEKTLLKSSKPFEEVQADMNTYLQSQPSLYVQDGNLGTNERSRIHVRSITNDPLLSLALRSITFPITDIKSKEGNEYNNNLTVYITRGNASMENGISSKLVSPHNQLLLINGDVAIRQMIDTIADAAQVLYFSNNRDVDELASTKEKTSKDTINTIILPCSCIRAKNNISTFIFSDEKNVNEIQHEYLDGIHRNSLISGSLYTLDHTVISNNMVSGLFGGVQLNGKIGVLQPATDSLQINDSILTPISSPGVCSKPFTYLFIQHATGMSEMTYQDFCKLMRSWSQPVDCAEYAVAWSKVNRCEYYRISYTIMKDMIQEMESIAYNMKEK